MSVTLPPEVLASYNAAHEKELEHVKAILDDPGWKSFKEEPDISFYWRTVPDSKFGQLKSVVSIPAPLEAVVTALEGDQLVDANTPKDKRDGCQSRYLFNPVAGDPCEGIFLYIGLETPTRVVWPRDFLLYRRKYPFNGGFIYLHCSVENETLKPQDKKNYVRGTIFFEADVAYPDPDHPGAVRFVFMTHADPMGSIPAWVYNTVATDQGYAAKKIRDQVLGKK
jgi:hypothetical protein